MGCPLLSPWGNHDIGSAQCHPCSTVPFCAPAIRYWKLSPPSTTFVGTRPGDPQDGCLSDLSAERVKALVGSLVLLDGRNIYDPQRLRDLEFTYWGMGRG